MFVVAFAVSWAFHQIDEIGTHKLERQQRILTCTIEGTALEQQTTPFGERVRIGPILEGCTDHVDK